LSYTCKPVTLLLGIAVVGVVIVPAPPCEDFPITEPIALMASSAFIACLSVGEVVSRSPTSVGE
jgi:hypothetical protein